MRANPDPVPGPAGEHVRVQREHDDARVPARGLAERLVEPGQIGGEPAGELRSPRRALRCGLTPLKPRVATVVAADDVQRRDDGAAVGPHHVLGEPPISPLAGLRSDRHRLAPERHAGPREEHAPQRCEPLGGLVAAGGGPVAVGPLVVARGVDDRVAEPPEEPPDLPVVPLAARIAADLDVAQVQDDVDVADAVDRVDEDRKRLDLMHAVRHVADHRERQPRGRGFDLDALRRSAAAGGEHEAGKRSHPDDRRSTTPHRRMLTASHTHRR